MSTKTAIEWTDATWNPVTGCTKVSAGCKHCYAERNWARLSANPNTAYYGRDFTDVRCHDGVLTLPLRWTRPRKVFVNSMSDLFHPDVPFEFIAAVFAVMATANRHTYQLLTKRPERLGEFFRWLEARSVGANDRYMNSDYSQAGVRARQKLRDEGKPSLNEPSPPTEIVRALYDIGAPTVNATMDNSARFHHLQRLGECHWMTWPLRHVWLGVSVEDQDTADERIPLLLRTHAAVYWVSLEPLLGPVDVSAWMPCRRGNPEACFPGDNLHKCCECSNGQNGLDWVVVGGESGPKARPMHPDWARSLRDQCNAASVPFLFKQWGEFATEYQSGRDINFCYDRSTTGGWIEMDGTYSLGDGAAPSDPMTAEHVFRLGKKAAGRLLDGREWNQYPEISS